MLQDKIIRNNLFSDASVGFNTWYFNYVYIWWHCVNVSSIL